MDADDHRLSTPQGHVLQPADPPRTLTIDAGVALRSLRRLVGPELLADALKQAGSEAGTALAGACLADCTPQEAQLALAACLARLTGQGMGQLELTALEWPIGRAVVRASGTVESDLARRDGVVADGPACAYTGGLLAGVVGALAGKAVVCRERECRARGAEACVFDVLPADQADGGSGAGDAWLGRPQSLLDSLFQRLPATVALAITDRDLKLRHYNHTLAQFASRYRPLQEGKSLEGTSLLALVPGAEGVVAPILRRALAGETLHATSLRVEGSGGVYYWDCACMPVRVLGETVGVMVVASDATAREEAAEALRESRRFLTTLMANLPGMVYRRRPDPHGAFEFVSEGCLALTGYAPAELTGERGPRYADLVHPEDRARVEASIQAALREKRPYGHTYRLTPANGSERWVLDRGQGVFGPDGQAVALEGFVTDHTGPMLAHLDLERRVEERTRELERRKAVAECLQDILAITNSTCSLQDVLDYIVARAAQLLGARGCLINQLRADSLLVIRAAHGLPEDYVAHMTTPFGEGMTGLAVAQRRPVSIVDIPAYFRENGHWLSDPVRGPRLRWLLEHYGASMAAPLLVKGEPYGTIAFYYAEPRQFTPDDLALAMALADQAALAIEAARLRAAASESAAATERRRVAQDLHDSVTQTLFSASLIAEALPTLIGRDPESARRESSELLVLTQGALAEMRTLLGELRPATLVNMALGDLLAQLVGGARARAQIPIRFTAIGQCRLSPGVQIALYRIAQEALNNVVRHSGASQAEVTLRQDARGVRLWVCDDGRGFAPEEVSAGHHGLAIMRERARAIGARMRVRTVPGQGTRISVAWSSAEDRHGRS